MSGTARSLTARVGMPGDEREIGGAVGESGGALVAQERGRVAEEDEVEVVIVVVVDPDGGLEAALRQIGGRAGSGPSRCGRAAGRRR